MGFYFYIESYDPNVGTLIFNLIDNVFNIIKCEFLVNAKGLAGHKKFLY